MANRPPLSPRRGRTIPRARDGPTRRAVVSPFRPASERRKPHPGTRTLGGVHSRSLSWGLFIHHLFRGRVEGISRGGRMIKILGAPRSAGPGGTVEHSPMFQHWVTTPLFPFRPGGTADDGNRAPGGPRCHRSLDAAKTQGAVRGPVGLVTGSSLPPGRRSFHGSNPTMNRWALVQMSLRDTGLRKRPSLPLRPAGTIGRRRDTTRSSG